MINYTAEEYAAALEAELQKQPHTPRTLEVLDLHVEAMGRDEDWEAADDAKQAAYALYYAKYPASNDFPSVYNGWSGYGSTSIIEGQEKQRGIYRHCYEGTGYAGMGEAE